MRDLVEVGMGRSARRGFHLDQVAIVPSRRTRDVDDVSLTWQFDAFTLDLPLVAHPSDATMSPASVVEVSKLGGLGVLNLEGLWTRYEDPAACYREILAADPDEATAVLQAAYAAPVIPELVTLRIKEMQRAADAAGGVPVGVRVSPQRTLAYAPLAVAAGVDVLVIQGTIVSAEHVSASDEPLNLKEFIADLDVPVLVGGCADYQTALHLMRTGAAGVIVGVGADWAATSDEVLGIRVPMASAIANAAAARRDYMDETGGRYVHVVADGDIATSGDIARAIACGADAVMLGRPLAVADAAPAAGAWWHFAASHPKLPRGMVDSPMGAPETTLAEVLFGPATQPDGTSNMFGGLARAMAKTGYRDVKEFQRVELVLDR